jgi:hypothetical protein
MNSDYLPIVLILVILAIIGGTIFYVSSWTSTFDQGDLSFEIAGGWSQSQVIGDFNNTVFSQVSYTKDIQDESGATQKAFIIVQMRKLNGGTNTSALQVSVLNVTNSTVTNLKINNYTVKQYIRNGPTVSNGISTISQGDFMIMIEYICPPSVLNETREVYDGILKTIIIK